ncbi:MAG: DEAD/DEAH box helicase family protein [Aeromicrobium sp.]
MNFELEEFQEKAAATLVKRVTSARSDYAADADELTAIGLTAPTGAGKTVIATSLLERLFAGDAGIDADPSLRVLWVTDDKSLNKQTIDKIVQASDHLDWHHIRFINEIDERTLAPGFIYFVHIQQLQKNSTLHAVRDGIQSDLRTYGVWDMIANTVIDNGPDLLVIVDEAHRGSSTPKDRGTIVSTIMNGGLTNIGSTQPAAPVVLGISATPEKFMQAMGASNRTIKQVQVPPGEVRESGLLKDRILVKHIAEEQVADHTMLTWAVDDLRASDSAWQKHHDDTGDRRVEPLLVVQVENAVSQKRLESILSSLEARWPDLKGMAVAHSFGDPHGPLAVGSRTVRYLAPEAIESDDKARVVLFKSALTTGWDCPRAEVLISFQSRESFTEIAQLIGRLVRTPLARRVAGDDLLNSVVAYLPGFNAEHVVKVVTALTSDETAEIELVIDSVDCVRSPTVPNGAFELLQSLPSYARPQASHASRTSQLMRLASQLVEHDVLFGASKLARDWLILEMAKHDALRTAEVDLKANDFMTVDVGLTSVTLAADVVTGSSTTQITASEQDLETYFKRAQKSLPDAAAGWYLNRLRDEGLTDAEAKARVAALDALNFTDVVERSAEELIKKWRSDHAAAVSHLPASARTQVEPLWAVGPDDMIATEIKLPTIRREATQKVNGGGLAPIGTYEHHMFVIPAGEWAGRFPTATTSWERGVLDKELIRPNLVAWYRNPPSGGQALSIPYAYGDSINLLHPDFLFFYLDEGQIVVDIIDPHRHDDSATAEKWAALARYAHDNAGLVRHVVAVIEDASGKLRSLDLAGHGVADKLVAAGDGGHIEALFDEIGVDY